MMSEGVCSALDTHATTSYDTRPAPPVDFGHVDGDSGFRAAAELVQASANIERRLHAAFLRLRELGWADVRLALVIGSSLLFPARTVAISLRGALQPVGTLADSTDMLARRKRAAALLERRLVRTLTESLADAPLRTSALTGPMSARVMLCAPRAFGVDGWTPRHWRGASPLPPEHVSDDELTDTTHDSSISPEAAPARSDEPDAVAHAPATRMKIPQVIREHRPQRRSYTRRASKPLPTEVTISCGPSEPVRPNAVWHECSTIIRGVAE